MSAPRLLVVEGDTAASRLLEIAVGGVATSDGYAQVLRDLCPQARVDIAYPADPGIALPSGEELAGYDGIAITGSSLHAYDDQPEVARQIDFIRQAFALECAIFGSCWGLQLLTVAAGGTVRRNPRGRELGFSRDIRLTDAGRGHAMYRAKPSGFCAPTVHLDEVETMAPGSILLATNPFSDVQAIELRTGKAIAWGVQYHPEYPLRELAAIIRRSPPLVREGFFRNEDDREAFARDLDQLDRDPDIKWLAWRMGIDQTVLDPVRRTQELANWLAEIVMPRAQQRASAA